MANKTVLVTGGTGFTGAYLLRLLCEKGYQVRAIRRQSSDVSAFEDLPIEWFIGNVYDQALLEKAMLGVQHVYHLAAAYRTTNLPDQEYIDVHLTSTQRMAKLALQQPEFERFVLVSTVGVLGHIENPPADENSPYDPGDLYQETKTDAEKWALEFAKTDQLPLTVVRPAAIYGPGDRRLLKLFKLAKLPLVPLIGWSKGLYHLIHVQDLASFIWFVTQKPEAEGNIYICADPQTSSIKEMIEIIAQRLNKKARFIRIPASPIFGIARVVDWLSRKIGIEPPIYPRRVAFFTKDRSFDTSKMQSLGYQYQYTKQQGLEELTDWYQQQGWL